MEKDGTKALSFQQPWAALITTGIKTVECRSRKVQTPIRDLLVCASKTASAFYPFPGLAYGYAMALVDVVDCVPFTKKHLAGACMDELPEKESYAWILENPRPVRPFPVHATASFFYVPDEIELVSMRTPEEYCALYRDIWHAKDEVDDDYSEEDFAAAIFTHDFF